MGTLQQGLTGLIPGKSLALGQHFVSAIIILEFTSEWGDRSNYTINYLIITVINTLKEQHGLKVREGSPG